MQNNSGNLYGIKFHIYITDREEKVH